MKNHRGVMVTPPLSLDQLSTSRSVRCSRERYSALAFRRGTTVNFSLLGATLSYLGELHNLSHLPILQLADCALQAFLEQSCSAPSTC